MDTLTSTLTFFRHKTEQLEFIQKFLVRCPQCWSSSSSSSKKMHFSSISRGSLSLQLHLVPFSPRRHRFSSSTKSWMDEKERNHMFFFVFLPFSFVLSQCSISFSHSRRFDAISHGCSQWNVVITHELKIIAKQDELLMMNEGWNEFRVTSLAVHQS